MQTITTITSTTGILAAHQSLTRIATIATCIGSRNSPPFYSMSTQYSQELSAILDPSTTMATMILSRIGTGTLNISLIERIFEYQPSNRASIARSEWGIRPINLSGLSAQPKTDTKNNLKVLTEELSLIESRIESLNSNSIDSYQLIYTNARIVTIQNAKDDWLKQNRIASRENAIETLEIEKARIINELTEERNRKLAELESRRETIKKQIDAPENANSKTENQSIKAEQSEPDESNQKASNSYYEEPPEETSNLSTDPLNIDLITDATTNLSGVN